MRALIGLLDVVLALGVAAPSLYALGWAINGGGLAMLLPLASLAACVVTGFAGMRLLHAALQARLQAGTVLPLHAASAVGWLVCALDDAPAALVLWVPLLGVFVGAGWLAERGAHRTEAGTPTA